MPDRLPSTLEEFDAMLSALDADLSRSMTLLRHMPMPIRPETIADQSRTLERLEMVARFLGLPVDQVYVQRNLD